jgi:hypothetical protein
MKKVAIVIVEYCGECPFFDNEYYQYNETCEKLNRIIPSDGTRRGRFPIPPDCPLKDYHDQDSEPE